MPTSLLAVVVNCREPRAQADFWGRTWLQRSLNATPDEFRVGDSAVSGTPLYFMKVPEPKVAKNRLHLEPIAEATLEDEVSRLRGLGAELVEVRHDPESMDNPDTWAVLPDPEGNEFCATSSTTFTGWA